MPKHLRLNRFKAFRHKSKPDFLTILSFGSQSLKAKTNTIVRKDYILSAVLLIVSSFGKEIAGKQYVSRNGGEIRDYLFLLVRGLRLMSDLWGDPNQHLPALAYQALEERVRVHCQTSNQLWTSSDADHTLRFKDLRIEWLKKVFVIEESPLNAWYREWSSYFNVTQFNQVKQYIS